MIGKIQYPLIGDPTWTLSKNFDVLIETEGLADRGTFVIDPEGKIQIVEINAVGIGLQLVCTVGGIIGVEAEFMAFIVKSVFQVDICGVIPPLVATRILTAYFVEIPRQGTAQQVAATGLGHPLSDG